MVVNITVKTDQSALLDKADSFIKPWAADVLSLPANEERSMNTASFLE
jgi:hypothetical protein